MKYRIVKIELYNGAYYHAKIKIGMRWYAIPDPLYRIQIGGDVPPWKFSTEEEARAAALEYVGAQIKRKIKGKPEVVQ